MKLEGVKAGITVKTNERLVGLDGDGLPKKFSFARKENQTGVVMGYFPTFGGDVWAVRHENGDEAAYLHTEFEEVSDLTEYDNMPHTD